MRGVGTRRGRRALTWGAHNPVRAARLPPCGIALRRLRLVSPAALARLRSLRGRLVGLVERDDATRLGLLQRDDASLRAAGQGGAVSVRMAAGLLCISIHEEVR